ncbi:MAG TPA: IS630 transposase-related protein [Pyrinomonadaceae bacterium]|jgi:transposase
MQAYSLDLRERVVSAYENGLETIPEVAERFSVSPSFIKKMLARKRSTGELKPVGHRGGQRKRLSDKHRQWLLKTVLAEPDMTLAELQERLAQEKNLSASVPTLSRELRRLNLRRKKNRWWLASETGGNVPGIGGE